MYELFLHDLPEGVVSCWFLQEGEWLLPGPLVSLRAQAHTYTLIIAGTDRFLQGGILQHIVAAAGTQVRKGSCLALLQLDAAMLAGTCLENKPCAMAGALDQVLYCSYDPLVHPAAPLHTQLLRHSALYRRWYRRFYPLFELRTSATALGLILLCWFLLQSLSHESLGDDPALLLYARFSFWGLLLALVGFGLLLVHAGIQVVAHARQRVHWRA